MGNKYRMEISTPSSTGGKSYQKEPEVGHVDDKLKPSRLEEIVELLGGPRHNTKAVVTKGRLTERYTDNSYSEYGLTQYWHTYERDQPNEKVMRYVDTKFHEFTPYASLDWNAIKAVETDLSYIQSQVGI